MILIPFFLPLLLQSNAFIVQSTSSFNESKLKGNKGFPFGNYRFQTCAAQWLNALEFSESRREKKQRKSMALFCQRGIQKPILLSANAVSSSSDLITKSMYGLSNYYRKSCLWNSECSRQAHVLIKFCCCCRRVILLILWFQITNHVLTSSFT